MLAPALNKIYGCLEIWRRRRFTLLLKLLRPSPSDVLLDIGGRPWNWASNPQPVKRIDTLNLDAVQWDGRNFPNHNIKEIVGDGCSLPFPDGSYDIAFSNSAIEHVGPWEKQQAFAGEIRRVGKAIWVQTPAYEFPIEPHYLAPFVHWLPKGVQRRIVRWLTPWGWLQKPSKQEADEMVESTHILTKRQVRTLFPDCEIYTERLLGFIPKSYIAIRRNL